MSSIDEILGTDWTLTNDLQVSPTGDLDLISGKANVELALLHRLMTKPGSFIHLPDYGIGLGEFQNAPFTLAVQRQLALRIREQFKRDVRVEDVSFVSIREDENIPGKIEISVKVRIKGMQEQALTFTPFNGLQV